MKGNIVPGFEVSPEFQRNAIAARVNYLTVDGTNLPYFKETIYTPLYPLYLFTGFPH